MKNPFYLDSSVYKTVGTRNLKADVQVPYASSTVPFGVKLPVVITIPTEAGLGVSYAIINKVHNEDVIGRRYIRVSPEIRAVDQPDVRQGPVQDCRDLLAWIHDGGLAKAIEKEHGDRYPVDHDRIYASGMSYGGLLALSLGWDVPRPVAGILAVSPPCDFSNPLWASSRGPATQLAQSAAYPDPESLRLQHAPNSSIFDSAASSEELASVDPVAHSSSSFPPTFIVHSVGDDLVPVDLSRSLASRLKEHGVRSELVEVEGDKHLFASRITADSEAAKAVARGMEFLGGDSAQSSRVSDMQSRV